MIIEEEVLVRIKEKLDHIGNEVNQVRSWIYEIEKKQVMISVGDGRYRKKVPFKPVKPASNEEMAFIQDVENLSEKRRNELSEEAQKELFFKNIEKSRSEALIKGIAIEDDKEAAVDD